jgi:hypothetical protein
MQHSFMKHGCHKFRPGLDPQAYSVPIDLAG